MLFEVRFISVTQVFNRQSVQYGNQVSPTQTPMVLLYFNLVVTGEPPAASLGQSAAFLWVYLQLLLCLSPHCLFSPSLRTILVSRLQKTQNEKNAAVKKVTCKQNLTTQTWYLEGGK